MVALDRSSPTCIFAGLKQHTEQSWSAGCFSRDAENNAKTGQMRGLDPSRVYATPAEMAKAEGARKDGIDFVVITTPNVSHYEIAKVFLNAAIHVASDKPLTTDAWQAQELQRLAAEKRVAFLRDLHLCGLSDSSDTRATSSDEVIWGTS